MRVGLLVFDDVEEMDFVGHLEVFGVASTLTKQVEVTTLSKNGEPIRCGHGLRVQPDHSFSTCPPNRPFNCPRRQRSTRAGDA